MLINPAAIALTRANAFQAARQIAGQGTPTTKLYEIADEYVKFVVPKANQALYIPQIVHDVNFLNIVAKAKEPKVVGAGDTFDVGDYGLTGSLVGGIPNWALFGGLGYLAYRYWKKKKKVRIATHKSSFVASGKIGG